MSTELMGRYQLIFDDKTRTINLLDFDGALEAIAGQRVGGVTYEWLVKRILENRFIKEL